MNLSKTDKEILVELLHNDNETLIYNVKSNKKSTVGSTRVLNAIHKLRSMNLVEIIDEYIKEYKITNEYYIEYKITNEGLKIANEVKSEVYKDLIVKNITKNKNKKIQKTQKTQIDKIINDKSIIYLTTKEVAKILRISVDNLYGYTCDSGVRGKRNKIPKHLFVKFHRKILFKKDKFFEWLEDNETIG